MSISSRVLRICCFPYEPGSKAGPILGANNCYFFMWEISSCSLRYYVLAQLHYFFGIRNLSLVTGINNRVLSTLISAREIICSYSVFGNFLSLDKRKKNVLPYFLTECKIYYLLILFTHMMPLPLLSLAIYRMCVTNRDLKQSRRQRQGRFQLKNEFLLLVRISKMAAWAYCLIQRHSSTSAWRIKVVLSSKWKLK